LTNPNEHQNSKKADKLRLKYSFIPAFILLSSLWIIKIFEWGFNLNLYKLGVFPLKAKGLWGIIFSPFIHSGWSHLLSNSIPILLLSWCVFYFYKEIAYRILIYSVLFTNILIWFTARPSWHIGVSGLIYALAAFLFLSGILRSYTKLIALSFVIVFLYGGLFWGVFPYLEDVSWEGHLYGAFAGFTLAFAYKNKGPQKPISPIFDYESTIPEEIWNAPHPDNENKKSEPDSDSLQ